MFRYYIISWLFHPECIDFHAHAAHKTNSCVCLLICFLRRCERAHLSTLAHRVKREETFGIKVSAQVNSAAEAFADFLFFVVQPNSRATNVVVYHNTHNRQHTRMEERHFLSLLFSRFLFHYFMTRAHIKEGRRSLCVFTYYNMGSKFTGGAIYICSRATLNAEKWLETTP